MSSLQEKSEWLDLLVNGYVKNTFRIYVPNIIIHNIKIFYTFKNVYPFNIYHYSDNFNKWNKINKNLNNVTEMYSIGKDLFYVTNNNQLFMAGKFIKKDYLKGKRIELISESRLSYHAIFYIENKLYGVGRNDFTQLSWKKHKNGAQICKDVNNLFGGSIKQIETGSQHSLFLTENGTVYGLGSNKYGQLLLKNREQNYDNFTLIPILKNIISIRCSSLTSYVLNSNGGMFSFGSSGNGSLGVELNWMGEPKVRKSKYRIKSNDKIVSIHCGAFHASFITEKMDIYLFGGNDSSQCGCKGVTVFVQMPVKLKRKHDFISIQCGGYHNIIKTNDNKYYAFGRNDKQQCLFGFYGNNTLNSYDNPQHISLKKLKKCIGNNNDIIGFKPTYLHTFIIQKV